MLKLDTEDKAVTLNKAAPYSAFINYISGYPEQVKVMEDGTCQKVVTAVILGQSELEYFINSGSFYNQYAAPQIIKSNATVVTQSGDGAGIEVFKVTQSNIDSGKVSNAMGIIAEALGHSRPDVHYIIGDGAVPGTSRGMLADDSTDSVAGKDGNRRYWSDFFSVVDYINSNYGHVMHLIECWYNADAAYVSDMKKNFWPFYFGVDESGNRVEIGSSVTGGGGYQLDHILWDADAPLNEYGRGVFARNQTSWHILTPMPYNDGQETAPESAQFSQGLRNEEPLRKNLKALESEPIASSVRLVVGPSTHLADFEGDIHPNPNSENGTALFARQFLPAFYRMSRMDFGEPEVVSVSGPDNGAYADIAVSLPNGGNLTTLRQLRGHELPELSSPHQQEVTGFEIFRIAEASRRPIFKTSESDYPGSFKGGISIVDSGSGYPRLGVVRVTPTEPFSFADSISYLRGQVNAMTQEDRDVQNEIFLDMLIEHIPELYDSTASYPYEGVPVRPLQSDLPVSVPAPPFVSSGVYFGGDTGFTDAGTLTYSGKGSLSLWLKNADDTWAQNKYVIQLRQSGSTKIQVATTSGNRYAIRLTDDGAQTATIGFNADAEGATFLPNVWYHIAINWTNTELEIYVNSSLVYVEAFNDVGSATLNQFGFVSESVLRNHFKGDIAHLWLSLDKQVDFSSDMEKFVINGQQVDLGGDGSAPTGTAPEFYLDGNSSSFNNKGSFGALTLTGSISDSETKPEYGE